MKITQSRAGARRGIRSSALLVVCMALALASIGGTTPAVAAPTGTVTEFSDGITGTPYGIAAGPDGDLWFTENAGNKIGRIDPTTGVVTEFSDGISAGAGLWGITAGSDGNVWFAEASANRIGKINPTTGVVSEYGVTGIPTGVTAGPDGNIYFTEYGTGRIGRINPSTGAVKEFSTPSGGSPWAIMAGSDGDLWFTESATAKVGRLDPATGAVREFSLTGGAKPLGIASGPDGSVWFTENSGARIGRINPTTGEVAEFPISTPVPRPTGIAAGPDGNMWFTEYAADRVGRITPDGQITEFPVGNQNLVKPWLIAAGPDGNLWFTENPGNRVARLAIGPPDVTAPETTISLDPAAPNGDNNWYTSAVGVSVSATDDASGVAETRCALDPTTTPEVLSDLPSTNCDYLSPGATVSTDGVHVLWAASADNAGNPETPVNANFQIDTTAPTVTCDASSPFTLGSTGNRVTATVEDPTSGPVEPSVSVLAPATSTGIHSLNLTGQDKAGNTTTVPCSYLVAYAMQPPGGFMSPAPKSVWKAGSAAPIKTALVDASGARISDAEGAGLAADCRVTFSATGAQSPAPVCMTYDKSKHQFVYPWKLGKALGAETLTVAISYPNTSAITTSTVTITITA